MKKILSKSFLLYPFNLQGIFQKILTKAIIIKKSVRKFFKLINYENLSKKI